MLRRRFLASGAVVPARVFGVGYTAGDEPYVH